MQGKNVGADIGKHRMGLMHGKTAGVDAWKAVCRARSASAQAGVLVWRGIGLSGCSEGFLWGLFLAAEGGVTRKGKEGASSSDDVKEFGQI